MSSRERTRRYLAIEVLTGYLYGDLESPCLQRGIVGWSNLQPARPASVGAYLGIRNWDLIVRPLALRI